MPKEIKRTFGDNKPEMTSYLCPQCGRTIYGLVEGELCPQCLERNLFADVRDYIRNNDVNEAQVAEHFGLPKAKIKQWIHDGKIEYKASADGKRSLAGSYCQKCGVPIAFGTLCTQCKMAEDNSIKGVGIVKVNDENSRMRFLEEHKPK